MINDHIASIPCFPRTLRNTWPIKSGRRELKISSTDGIAKDVAISKIHPIVAVAITETIIARGAALAAFAVSSEMCAAESSVKWKDIASSRRSQRIKSTYTPLMST